MSKLKILLVEDDESIRDPLAKYLEQNGFAVDAVGFLAEAYALAGACDLAVVDWNLPDGEGIDLIRQMQQEKIMSPVILLTARADLIDRIVGLESGAIDYLTKPFSSRELLARIRAQLRLVRSVAAPQLDLLTAGPVTLDVQKREVMVGSQSVVLRNMEFNLLRYFLENPNRILSRADILDAVWGVDSDLNTRTVDTHILNLRDKLGVDLIQTIRSHGYRLSTKGAA